MSKIGIDDITNKLERLRQLRKPAIVFLGAGASQSAGIPTAKGIIDYIKNEESLKPLIQNAESDDYFEIMYNLDPGERLRIFRKFINKAKINETHLITCLLVKLGYVDCIVTTNFDPLIKRSLILLNIDIPIYDIPNNVKLTTKEIKYPAVFHLHGTLDHEWQYNTLEELNKKEEKIREIISKISEGRAWIIVGYGGNENEPVFNGLCNVEKFDEGLFWIGYRDQKPTASVKKKLLSDKTLNAHYINGYDSDEFFINLVKKLDKITSRESGDFLKGVESTIEWDSKFNKAISKANKEELGVNNNLSLDFSKGLKPKINKFQPTPSCKTWINKTSNQLKPSYQPKKNNFFKTIIDFVELALFDEKKEEKYLYDQNFQKLLTAAEQAINNFPNNGFGYYYKAIALGNLAQEKPVDQRQEDYLETRKSFETAAAAFDTLEEKPEVANRIPLIKNAFWRTEHNEAVEIVTTDSLKEAVGLSTAIAHLENATTIMPDSVLSWEVLTEVYVMNENMDGAIRAMSNAIKKLDQPESNKFRRLALFHRNQQNPEKAIKVLEQGNKLYPDNVEITEDLTDAYLQTGRIERGISTIQELIDRNSNNPQYRLVFGTAVYQSALKLNSTLSENYDKLSELKKQMQDISEGSNEAAELKNKISELTAETEQLHSEVDDLTDQAISQLEKVMELDGQNFKAVNTLGIIYQNKAAALIEKRNNTSDNKKAAEYDQQSKVMLEKTAQYYEKAAEIQPDNQDVWRNLSQVYTARGLNKKAREASEKAGL